MDLTKLVHINSNISKTNAFSGPLWTKPFGRSAVDVDHVLSALPKQTEMC